jgi:hypothetical protein
MHVSCEGALRESARALSTDAASWQMLARAATRLPNLERLGTSFQFSILQEHLLSMLD